MEESLRIDAEPGVVYEALTTPDLLRKWLCHDARVEPRVGGHYDLTWSADDRGASVRYEGAAEIVELEPPKRLAFRLAPEDGPSNDSVVEFRLEPAEGATEVTLTQTGFRPGDEGQAEMDRYLRGWRACLAVLRSLVEDEPGARLTAAYMHRDIPIPGLDPCGLAWDGTWLWLSDGGRGRIYQLDPADGQVQRSFPFDGEPAGMAWDGEALWQADREDRVLVKIDPQNGRVQKRMHLPQAEGELTGVAWDGSHLWVGVTTEFAATVIRVHPRSPVVYNKLPVSPHVSGLAWDGARLWYADFEERTVSCLEPRSGRIVRRIAMRGNPTGLTWDGERLWYADSEWKLASRVLDDVFGD